MKKSTLLIIVLVASIVALSVVKTFISNNIATSGVMLVKMEQAIGSLKTENALIAEKLYKDASLTSVYEKADKIGYVKNSPFYVVNSKFPIAARQ